MLTWKTKHTVLASLHELTKQNTIKMGTFFFRDCEKDSISKLFQKVCLIWKLSPIISRWGVGIRISWIDKIAKLISGGRLLGNQE